MRQLVELYHAGQYLTSAFLPVAYTDQQLREHFSSITQLTVLCKRPEEAPYSVLAKVARSEIKRIESYVD